MNAHNSQGTEPAGRVPANGLFHPATDLERDCVREQLGRILASSAFQNTKRYAAVLEFIVGWTLNGSGDRLKERIIGMEVFARRPDYDTATDHVVRSAVAEVRKRLAQYYLQSARGELRIDIPSGSYMPQFHWPDGPPEPLTHAPRNAADPPAGAEPQPLPALAARNAMFRPLWIVAACALAIAAIAALVTAATRASDPLLGFWSPVLTSRAPILLCVGNAQAGEESPQDHPQLNPKLTLREFHNAPSSTVYEYDAFTLAKLAGLMQAHGKKLRLESQSETTFTDLQNGPVILVGLFNNTWTERLMPKLRFTVERPTPDLAVIRDRNNPSNNAWSTHYSAPYLSIAKDYALVLRMVDPQTEQTTVVVAGITGLGTSAAGNFLTNENEIRKLAAVAPRGWVKKNMEIVLSTDVIGGRPGPASIMATEFW